MAQLMPASRPSARGRRPRHRSPPRISSALTLIGASPAARGVQPRPRQPADQRIKAFDRSGLSVSNDTFTASARRPPAARRAGPARCRCGGDRHAGRPPSGVVNAAIQATISTTSAGRNSGSPPVSRTSIEPEPDAHPDDPHQLGGRRHSDFARQPLSSALGEHAAGTAQVASGRSARCGGRDGRTRACRPARPAT